MGHREDGHAEAPAAREADQHLIDLLHKVGGRHGATPAKVALAWLLATADELDRVASTMVIRGARHPDQILRHCGL